MNNTIKIPVILIRVSDHGINSKHNTRHTEHILNRQHRSLRDNERNVPGYLYRFR
ncbi:hypothetical protein OENI_160010 [Oenococcus oeni]|nr:hypothetical protein OENI_160010 [Oenococcus oeni]